MALNRRFAELDAERARLQAGGGAEKAARQHEQGKLTARERLSLLFDDDTFVEFGLWVKHRCLDLADREFPADGVVTGKGEVTGRPVFAFSQDFTVGGGAVGERHAAKIVEMLATALKCGVPVVGFNDGGGARIQEGVGALSGYGRIFYHNTLLSGVVPQISVVAGPCAGGAAYSPALTDFVIMVDSNYHESRNRGRVADYVVCSEPSSKRAFYNTVTLKSFRPDEGQDVHGEWMGVVKFSQRGAKVVADKLRGLKTEPERLRTMKLPDLIQMIVAAGHAVRVIYTSGHWLDVDSVDDVVVGAQF